MIRNSSFRHFVLFAAGFTLLFSGCGFVFFGTLPGLLFLLLGTGLTALFSWYTAKRYQELAKLSDLLFSVLAGNTIPKMEAQEEGEISILRSLIFKTTAALQNQKELLARDQVFLAQAIADISHQLKTPLTSLMMMNDLLRSEEDAERRQKFLAAQSQQLDRMNWLIQTLLKLSKLDAGTVELRKENVAASRLIASAVRPFEIPMELKGIKAEIGETDLILRCDWNWTLEALQNIIKNCVEHMDHGGVLRIACEETGIFSEIRISDTGCGIAQEDLPHIFERFYKGKNAGKDSVGIGLALAETIVKQQHGEILVQSQEGIGTVFQVRLYKTII
jgi:signal transduction histidine kinase